MSFYFYFYFSLRVMWLIRCVWINKIKFNFISLINSIFIKNVLTCLTFLPNELNTDRFVSYSLPLYNLIGMYTNSAQSQSNSHKKKWRKWEKEIDMIFFSAIFRRDIINYTRCMNSSWLEFICFLCEHLFVFFYFSLFFLKSRVGLLRPKVVSTLWPASANKKF
jgi:hypothetical protein